MYSIKESSFNYKENKMSYNFINLINDLEKGMKKDSSFISLLEESLNIAKTQAADKLNKDLYKVLDWPTSFSEYLQYLKTFARWIPHQDNISAWEVPINKANHQEIFDRINHFYYLINQKVGSTKYTKIVQSIPFFAQWLTTYASVWGSFLDTVDSFNDNVLKSLINYSSQFRVEDSMLKGKPNNPSGWLTFNQFFARELNPGLRPITEPMNNYTIVSPADCTYRQQFPIAADSSIDKITIKSTHSFANIRDLLQNSMYNEAFANGKFAHCFLSPYSYHRFHLPVSGVVKECYPITGLAYLNVGIQDGNFFAQDDDTDGYEFSQARGVITIDTTESPFGNVGIVAVIPVGMTHIESIKMTAAVGGSMLKGDEFGYFLFGGSDIIVLFQDVAGLNLALEDGSNYRHYGTTKIAEFSKK